MTKTHPLNEIMKRPYYINPNWRYYVWKGSTAPWYSEYPVNLHDGAIIEISFETFIDLCIIAGTYPQITLI